jgi:CheY-like chemotaxis protein
MVKPKEKSILLVDDDQTSIFICRKVLQTFGLFNEIHSASNGVEALNFYDQCVRDSRMLPEIILLDINMPVMNGFQFISAFSQSEVYKTNKISIIIVSSSNYFEDIQRAKELGINHYIHKPVTIDKLKEVLNAVITE